ncbi:Eco57I restriction-modification methylase domain-containing protein [Gracilibacillus massiliensis]|uniref:Eco57I restriction-modification methylase domain-containing protein n=1 Tax=Gracilibacillus massiliensis TaxID=1564956 RepID=UPI00071E06CC|nr:N-6 DNA methylase [Gracilibacillus massiliensis]
MQTKGKEIFTTIRTEGALLPTDTLQRILDGDKGVEGLEPYSYHLAKGEKVNEAINRSWNRLLGAWSSFKNTIDKLPGSETGTSITRERWLLILFQELGFGRLLPAKGIELNNKSYPISHIWQHTPIHLVGYRIDLDHRTAGIAGAARMSPHSLVQELLNRSDSYLWGIVSNGLELRLLRDNVSLTRQAYVQFDLEAIMEGQVYSDFVILWLLCHQSRFESEKPENCWIETWSKSAKEHGTRALDQLRKGVEQAITSLGQGLILESSNSELRDKLVSGTLSANEYYRQLLRIVYRFIFLFVAEDRNLLFDPQAKKESLEMYNKYYSMSRLRKLAAKRVGTKHTDLFQGILIIMNKLQSGYKDLALPALGSFLWSDKAAADLNNCNLANHNLLASIRSISFIFDGGIRRPVDYKNLGAEELGSIYESLLELHPVFNLESATFELTTASGNERKTTGSYYTPTSLISSLLDSSLEPVLNEVSSKKDAESAILNLKICDPACGSGHFLIAAAHRIAKRLAMVRTGDDEPSPNEQRKALRDVIGRCIYGVDVNEMAVELCKVSLWMEALQPGKPLSFLDHHIQCGNSLFGTTPTLMAQGIPNEVFNPIEGDDKEYCKIYKKENRNERKNIKQISFFELDESIWQDEIYNEWKNIHIMKSESIEELLDKENKYNELINSTNYIKNKLVADAWCASFVWRKTNKLPYPITEKIYRTIESNPFSTPKWLVNEIKELAQEYRFFHFHIAFPEVFKQSEKNNENKITGLSGGFDVVLGNPPWERIKLQEKEWFSQRLKEIANAPNASKRKQLINSLSKNNPQIYKEFLNDKRKSEGELHFIKKSNRYPLCGRGDVNTYAVFAETNRLILNKSGRIGCIVPSGIATDDTTKYFFQNLMETHSLVSLFDFENSMRIFPGVHREQKFCLLTITANGLSLKAKFAFFIHKVDQLSDENKIFSLTAEEIALINPNTKTCPIFKTNKDADIIKSIYANHNVLKRESEPAYNPFNIRFLRMFDMTNNSSLFLTESELIEQGFRLEHNTFINNSGSQFLPLYEGKLTHIFDHRYTTFLDTTFEDTQKGNPREVTENEHGNPSFEIKPRFWVDKTEYCRALEMENIPQYWLTFHGISNPNNERTFISTICPSYPMGNSLPAIYFDSGKNQIEEVLILCANFNSFVFDYISRLKIGSRNVNFFVIKQLPIIESNKIDYKLREIICDYVLELSYTSSSLEKLAQDYGYQGPPFEWDEERRLKIQCKIDAIFFYLYGLQNYEIEHIMESFNLIRKRDEQNYGSFKTKDTILKYYNELIKVLPDVQADIN